MPTITIGNNSGNSGTIYIQAGDAIDWSGRVLYHDGRKIEWISFSQIYGITEESLQYETCNEGLP